jgi:hypothetical protein
MSVAFMRASWLSRVAAGTLLLLGPGPAGAQQPDGGEFVVNTYTTGTQWRQQLARRADGSFLVVWSGAGAGDPNGVFGQLYDASGAAVGGEFRLNTFTGASQFKPAAAVIGPGDFIVVWGSFGQDSGTIGVYGQRVSATGAPLGAEFRVNTYTPGFQDTPRVAGHASGFVVVWDSEGQDGSEYGIFGQRFTAGGAPVGSEFQVNSYTSGYQYRSAVAMDASGAFVVVWTDYPRVQMYGQRFAPDGTPLGGEFQALSGFLGTVGMDAAGNFVVTGVGYDDDAFGISAQRFSSAGAAQGTEFAVNTRTTGYQLFPELAMAPAGDFVVAWHTYNFTTYVVEDSSARAFRADGTPATPEFVVNTYTVGEPEAVDSTPAVAIDGSGRFVIAWTSPVDGSGTGVAAQRFLSADVIFADGFDSGS